MDAWSNIVLSVVSSFYEDQRKIVMEFLTSGLSASFVGTFLWLIILWVADRIGNITFKVLKLDLNDLSAQEVRLFAVGTGLIFISLEVLFLGLFHELSRLSLIIFLVLTLLISLAIRPLNPKLLLDALSIKFGNLLEKLIFCFIVLVFLMAWIQAMAPPIGNDALAYHLFYPKEFILQHKIFYVENARESLWPFQTEMFFLLGLLLQGTSMVQAVHWSFFILTALAIHAFALRYFGSFAAMIAVLIFVLCPAAFAQSGHAYVDLVLAFYVFLAVYAFMLNGILPMHSAALLSGIAAAGALSTKYLGISAAATLFFLWVISTKVNLKGLGLWILGAVLFSSVWYLRSWWVIGNPVYPFFSKIFGSGLDFDIAANVGMGKRWIDFMKFPWNLTMYPNNFGGESVGPLFLIFTPCLIFRIRSLSKQAIYFVLFTVVYTFLLFKQSQHARFYLSVVPFLSVAAAIAFCSLQGIWLKRAGFFCLGIVLLIHSGVYVYRLRNCWKVVLGQETAQNYLAKFERSFEGYRYFKEHASADTKIFNSAEVRAFYNENPGMIFDSIFLRQSLQKSGRTLEDYLDKERFQYIWLQEGSDPALFQYVQRKGYSQVFRYDATERPTTFHYLVFETKS